MKRIVCLIILVVVVALNCSSLMMSVKDRDKANKNIVLKSNDDVSVLLPEIRAELTQKMEKAGWDKARFATTLQEEIIKELTRRDIKAKADSSKDGNFLLIHINDYNAGSKAARALGITGIGLAESTLEGTAILRTSTGQRELELKKQGHKSGVVEAGDQTSDNIRYFASALASKICTK